MFDASFGRKPGAAFLLLGIATLSHAAPTPLMPLAPGTYVIAQKAPCRDAPLAAVVAFDGRALSGPHEAGCSSVLLSRHGKTYRVSTTCTALGDGTAAAPYTQVRTLRVISRTRFASVDNGAETTYARCRSFGEGRVH